MAFTIVLDAYYLNVAALLADCRCLTSIAYKLYKSRSVNVRVNFFACRVVNVWNSLPDTVCFTSLAVFKEMY